VQCVEDPADPLEIGIRRKPSIFVLFRAPERLYNVIGARFRPLWG
jgi:hypothetical protein